MKFCPKCATQCSEEILFCPNCGTKIGTITPVNNVPVGGVQINNGAPVGVQISNGTPVGAAPATNVTISNAHTNQVPITNMNVTNINKPVNASVPVTNNVPISDMASPVAPVTNQASAVITNSHIKVVGNDNTPVNPATINNSVVPEMIPIMPQVPVAPVNPATENTGKSAKSKKEKVKKESGSKSKTPLIVLLILCIAIIAASVIIVFVVIKPFDKKNKSYSGNSLKYDEVLDTYIDYYNDRNACLMDYLKIVAAPCLVDAYYEYSDVLINIDKDMVYDFEDEYMKELIYTNYDIFDTVCGSDWKMTISNVSYEPLSDAELKQQKNIYLSLYNDIIDPADIEDKDKIKDDYFNDYQLTNDEAKTLAKASTKLLDALYETEIEEGYKVTFDFEVSGSKGSKSDTETWEIIQINGSWILTPETEDPFSPFFSYAMYH